MEIYLDTEFSRREVLVFAILTSEGERLTFDTRAPEGRTALSAFVELHRESATWISYSVMAEMESLMRCGIPVNGMKWFDLMTEAGMITRTFEPFFLHRNSLLGHLDIFQIPHQTKDYKRDMIELILSEKDFTDEEYEDICEYCWTDVDPLPLLYAYILASHEDSSLRSPWEMDHAILRGEYSKACAILEFRSKGFPVNEVKIRDIFENKGRIRFELIKHANKEYGFPIWRTDGSFDFKSLEAYLSFQPWGLQWERTPSGRLRTDQEYINDLIKQFPNMRTFGWVRDGLNQLKDDGLVNLIEHDEDGLAYIKPASIPFWTVTSRNQPLVKRGFILNMPPWLRCLAIKPHPGKIVIGADWGKQEIAIGCALSGDRKLLEAYLTGDIYLTLAKMAGAVPEDGTKASHPLQRQAFKAAQLALGYGMGKKSLARKIYNEINGNSKVVIHDMEWCQKQADTIFDWHKRTFKVYWDFLEKEKNESKRRGYNYSMDGWMYYANDNTKATRLINFPIQSNGAVMLREAIKDIAHETDLNVICSLHDAIYVECDAADEERVKALLKLYMDRAAEAICGDISIEIGFKVYTHESGFHDERGTETLEMIEGILKKIEEAA